jgi:hypothetical protein
MKPLRWLILGAVLVGMFAGANVHRQVSRADDTSCPQIVDTALTLAEQLCMATGRNQACYGHGILDAKPQSHAEEFVFDHDGDLAQVSDIQTLRLGGMDVDTGSWGVALLRVQANLSPLDPRQNVTLVLFGDVEVGSQPAPGGQVEVNVQASSNINVRQSPEQSAAVISQLAPNQVVTATGRLADLSWVRVIVPDSGEAGWVAGWLLAGALDQLEVVEQGSPVYGPMQAFYFESAKNDSACQEAPNSGLLIQTPEGGAQVSFLINEVDVQLGSTIYFQAQPGGDMTVYVVEGSAQITAFDESYRAVAGTKISLPLDDDLSPAGPPRPPVAYDPAEVAALPLNLLERDIEIVLPEVTEEPALTLTELPASQDTATETGENQTEGETEVSKKKQSQTPTSPAPGQPTATQPATAPAQPTAVPTTEPPTAVPPTAVPPPTEIPPTEEEKVTICHKGKNTITIGISALPAHLAHGDTMGPCP